MIRGVAEMLGFGGLLDWVANRPDITKYAENKALSTVCISPILPNMDASSFGNKNSRSMIKMGEDAAMKHWDELMRIKEQLNLL